MVVRSLIESVVNQLPLNQYIPNTVTHMLDIEIQSKSKKNTDTKPSHIALNSVSPRDKIHSSIIENRVHNSHNEPTNKVSFDDPPAPDPSYKFLDYSDTCDDFVRDVEQSPINRIKEYYFQPNLTTDSSVTPTRPDRSKLYNLPLLNDDYAPQASGSPSRYRFNSYDSTITNSEDPPSAHQDLQQQDQPQRYGAISSIPEEEDHPEEDSNINTDKVGLGITSQQPLMTPPASSSSPPSPIRLNDDSTPFNPDFNQSLAFPASQTPPSSSSSDQTRESRMKQYLDEQNKKFDNLINSNLDVVLQQQTKFGDDSRRTSNSSDQVEVYNISNDHTNSDNELQNLMIDLLSIGDRSTAHKVKYAGRVARFASRKLWSSYHFPFFGRKREASLNNDNNDNAKDSNDIQHMVDNQEATDCNDGKIMARLSEPVKILSESELRAKQALDKESQEKWNSLNEMISTADTNTKIRLFQTLHQDLLKTTSNEELQVQPPHVKKYSTNDKALDEMINDCNSKESEPDISTSGLIIDKLEILSIVSIKLMFLGIKFSIPLVNLLYDKFINNQLYVINNRNFDRFITMTIRSMKFMESKLSNEKLKSFQYGNQSPDTRHDNKHGGNQQAGLVASDDNGVPSDEQPEDLSLNDLYNEMSNNARNMAANYIKTQLGINENYSTNEGATVVATDGSANGWTKIVARPLLSRFYNQPSTKSTAATPLNVTTSTGIVEKQPEYYRDPKYAKYFSQHHNHSGQNDGGQNDSGEYSQPINRQERSIESFKTAYAYGPPSDNNILGARTPMAMTTTDNNDGGLSVFKIAEQFVEDF